MATLLQKIQDTARRIDRLGQYASYPETGHSVTKARGILSLSSGGMFVVMCNPREGRVWLHDTDEPTKVYPDYTPEEALRKLRLYEDTLLVQACTKAREEVIQELVEKRIKRITRAKTRGFKADQKKPNA